MLTLVLVALLPVVFGSPDEYIIGGDNATDPTEWPWQGSLLVGGAHSCGCVLISENWILTAAHCIAFDTPYQVRFGSVERGEGTLYEISEVIQHEDFMNRTGTDGAYPNDIGLMVPATPVVLSDTVQPVPLDSEQSDLNCWITGWGQTQVGILPSRLPKVLQEASTDVLTDDQATEVWGEDYNGDIHISVQDLEYYETGACSGDSGGPLVCEASGGFEVRGVTSWGIASCDPIYPSTYTRIYNFRDWICENTGEELGC